MTMLEQINELDTLRNLLPMKIYEIIDRAGICTRKQVLTLSLWDIRKLTGLQIVDTQLLKTIVAKHSCNQIVPCNKIFLGKNSKLKSGCTAIDNLLNGGFSRGVLTEIYGESGSGKTQLGMQLAANNANEGSVYICTEDLFPIKRYNQIHESISTYFHQLDNNVFVEHVYEALELLSCVRVRLPKLLQQHKVSLVIIDSVAAPFRSGTCNYIRRAEELRELALTLTKIAQENNLAVICINQVTTTNFEDSSSKILPSLGLAWSNMLTYRFCLKKCSDKEYLCHTNLSVRELKTVFAPDLPNSYSNFIITSKGLVNM